MTEPTITCPSCKSEIKLSKLRRELFARQDVVEDQRNKPDW